MDNKNNEEKHPHSGGKFISGGREVGYIDDNGFLQFYDEADAQAYIASLPPEMSKISRLWHRFRYWIHDITGD